MTHFSFYVRHSINDMRQNGRRTLFALFCVAAGVAAIVALRTLGLSIGQTLTDNIAATNKGDIRITARYTYDPKTQSDTNDTSFSRSTLGAIQNWAKTNNVTMTTAVANANISVASMDGSAAGRPQFVQSILIDPAVYPFYQDVIALDPPGVPLAKLFTGGNDVVISKILADQQNLKVGDQVRAGRTTEPFTVRGIVPPDIEGFRSLLVLFFGYAYFDQASAKTFDLSGLPDEVYLKAPQGSDVTALRDNLLQTVPTVRRAVTVVELRENNKQIADIVDRLIVAMGLIALLIGATGIIHTMLVVVRRRTLEIAVLKTLGVKGRQISLLFLVEAVIMGVLGSLLGVFLGVMLSIGVNAFAQQLTPQTLHWQIYPAALWTGFSLGVIVTTVFGFLPTLTAASVRPAVVLRPNEARLPALGCLQAIIALLFVVVGVGAIVGNLVGNIDILRVHISGFAIGVFLVALTLGVLGFFVVVLWFLVLLISVMPSFRSIDLRLALRGIGEHRFRTSSTLLALIAGMFALSSIALISSSVPKLLNLGFQNVLGGNVVVFTPLALLRPIINVQLNSLPGVEHFSQIAFYTGDLVSINGDRDYAKKVSLNIPIIRSGPAPDSAKGIGGIDSESVVRASFSGIAGQDVTAKGFSGPEVVSGRTLNAGDAGKQVMVVRESDITTQLGLKPGDKLVYRFGNRGSRTYELVGLMAATSGLNLTDDVLAGSVAVPIDSFPPGVSPAFEFTVAQVTEAKLNETLIALQAIPGIFSIDVGFVDSFIKKLINQFAVIPTIVAVLSLFAGAVIIANTVSLATLERRRQMGVMKAVGLRGRRALFIMILENGIVGLVGGIIGVGIGVLATWGFSIGSGLSIFESVNWWFVLILLGIAVAITLSATMLSAWTAVGEKPLNVLRYE